MDYNVKTRVILNTNFNTSECNDLIYESAKPHIIEDIKSVVEEDPTLPQYIDGDLTFCFLCDYRVLLKYQFSCNDDNEAEAESFSKSCVEDIREKLEGKGYRIERISCTAAGLHRLSGQAGGYGLWLIEMALMEKRWERK